MKAIGVDTQGFEIITNAVRAMLNTYPDLQGDTITFESLDKNSGVAFSADNGALIITEKRTVNGRVKQRCQYPFYVVYRLSANAEKRKISTQAFLNNLGRWLSAEPTEINGQVYKISYPELTGGRKIEKITRMNSYGLEPYENNVQDWLLPCTLEYTNEYDEL